MSAFDDRPSVAVLTNSFAPYRTPFFNDLARRCALLVTFDTRREDDREWVVDERAFDFEWALSRSLAIRRTTEHGERRSLHVPLNIVGILNRFQPDVVVSSELGVRTAYAAAYCRVRRRPLITWWEGTPVTDASATASTRFRRRSLLRRATRAWANGELSAASLTSYGFPNRCIDRGMTGIDTARWSADVARARTTSRSRLRAELALSGTVLLFVGRLSARKGLDELLRAMSVLADEPGLPRWSALFVGSGPAERAIVEWSERHPAIPVRLTGFAQPSQLAPYYAAGDLIVMPSLEDVWGLVCLEALTARLPQVASRFAGAGEELVTSPEIGELVDPRDTPALAQHLAARIRRGPEMVSRSIADRAVEQWSTGAMAERAAASVRSAATEFRRSGGRFDGQRSA